MGGIGSGRRPERDTVKSAFRLEIGDVLAVLPRERLRIGTVEFTAILSRPGGRLCRATDAVLVDARLGSDGGTLRIRYDARPFSPGAQVEPVPIDETIAVVTRPQPFGGVQFFLVCPFTGQRAKSLFMARNATRFGCRESYRLVYASQRRGPADRALALSRKIRTGLGGSPSVLDPFPERPCGMRHKRYDRLQARDEAASRVSLAAIERKLDRLAPGWREQPTA